MGYISALTYYLLLLRHCVRKGRIAYHCVRAMCHQNTESQDYKNTDVKALKQPALFSIAATILIWCSDTGDCEYPHSCVRTANFFDTRRAVYNVDIMHGTKEIRALRGATRYLAAVSGHSMHLLIRRHQPQMGRDVTH